MLTVEDLERARARFWGMVAPSPNGCFLWAGHRNKSGYGNFKIHSHPYRAHRIAKMLEIGAVLQSGEIVCHACDNPSCVNPAHLFVGTLKQNSRDMVAKGRHRPPRRKLDPSHVAEIRQLAHLPRAEVARRFGVSTNTVTRVIRGRTHHGR